MLILQDIQQSQGADSTVADAENTGILGMVISVQVLAVEPGIILQNRRTLHPE